VYLDSSAQCCTSCVYVEHGYCTRKLYSRLMVRNDNLFLHMAVCLGSHMHDRVANSPLHKLT